MRFNYTRYNEDHVFNGILISIEAKMQYINIVTYVWKTNSNSLTRTDGFHTIGNKDYLINARYFISELQKRNVNKNIIIEYATLYILNSSSKTS